MIGRDEVDPIRRGAGALKGTRVLFLNAMGAGRRSSPPADPGVRPRPEGRSGLFRSLFHSSFPDFSLPFPRLTTIRINYKLNYRSCSDHRLSTRQKLQPVSRFNGMSPQHERMNQIYLSIMRHRPVYKISFSTLFFLLLFSRLLFAEPPSDRLTLDQAIALALRSHPSLAAARGTARAQEARLGQAKADFYPHLDLTASYRRATA